MFLKHTMLASGLALMATGAYAGCGLSGGNVNVLGNELARSRQSWPRPRNAPATA